MRLVSAKQKQYKCDQCGEVTEPLDLAGRVPECWFRIQQKTWRFGAASWETLRMLCPKCSPLDKEAA